MSFTPEATYLLLLVVQAAHLLHHRLSKQHIGFVEVVTAAVLCVPPSAPLPPTLLVTTHLTLAVVQVVGSIFIRDLSPECTGPDSARPRLG